MNIILAYLEACAKWTQRTQITKCRSPHSYIYAFWWWILFPPALYIKQHNQLFHKRLMRFRRLNPDPPSTHTQSTYRYTYNNSIYEYMHIVSANKHFLHALVCLAGCMLYGFVKRVFYYCLWLWVRKIALVPCSASCKRRAATMMMVEWWWLYYDGLGNNKRRRVSGWMRFDVARVMRMNGRKVERGFLWWCVSKDKCHEQSPVKWRVHRICLDDLLGVS